MRLLVLPTVLFLTVVMVLPVLARPRDKTTDYDFELEQIRKHLVTYQNDPLTHPMEMDRARSFIHLLYRQASLTMSYSDCKLAKAAIDNAGQQIDSWEELYILKAALDLKFHQLPNVRDSLNKITGLIDSIQVKTLKADLAFQEGRYGEAQRGYEDVINKNRTWDNLARLAYLRSKMGDASGAGKLYVEAEAQITAKDMRSFSWLELQRGLLDFQSGRHEEALVHYERANKAYSGYWLVDAHLAEVFGALGKFDKAAALYETLIARTVKPELQQALGDLYLFMGKANQAQVWHAKALTAYLASAQRGEVHYFHHLARYYADVREEGAEAVKWARMDLQLRRNFSTHDAMAWALYRNGQFSAAIEEMDAALSSGVRDAHLFFHAAMIYLAEGRIEESKQFLKQATDLNPHFTAFHAHH